MGRRSRKAEIDHNPENILDEILNEEDKNRRQIKILNHNFKLQAIKPLTENQKKVFLSYNEGQHLLLCGCAGTGKTFLALYLALSDLLAGHCQKIIVVRSAVSSRDQGFMPGTLLEKMSVYEIPYKEIVSELCGDRKDVYDLLKKKGYIDFMSTSYLRGLTFDNAVIILDEVQNLTDHEISSVLTRVGQDCRVVLCGDFKQDDLKLSGKRWQESGINNMFQIARAMRSFDLIEFGINDIIRSGFVKEYILTRVFLNID